MLGHDAARSGGTPAQPQPPFVRKWYRLFPEEGIQSGVQPVIVGGKVFLGTLAGVLHALDAETGREVWSYRAGGPILHAAAVAQDRVFFGCADGQVHALNTLDGKPLWSYRTAAAVWNAPAIQASLVLVGSRDGRLLALEVGSGQVRWAADLGAPILNSPAIDAKQGRVYVGAEDLKMRAFALADGRPVWTSERLPGASLRGYHPVIAPDGAVLVTTAPVIGYDRFQALLMDMAKEVFGDIASWRHKKKENDRWRAENFRLLEKPETYDKQLEYLRRRLTDEPAFQTFFVLDPATGRQRFVAPIVASESMNGPGAPPLVTPEGRVIVKYQVVSRSRYEHYSPFLNVGYLDTTTGHVTPLMDQSRTYGWHDSLLLVHDEQCQLSVAGRLLLNTHQDNVNALDLDTLKGFAQPFAWNIHEPAPGEALTLRLAVLRGQDLSPGNEWLMRGTAVYGGGSVLDVPVAIAGDSFYYLPTHELNSGCALIAYRSQRGATPPKRTPLPTARPSAEEWQRIQDLPWDWDSLATPRLKNLLQALPGSVPGTAAAPLTTEAEKAVAAITDQELEGFIWEPAFDPAKPLALPSGQSELTRKLRDAVRELLSQTWRPLLMPAGKAPQEAHRYFSDPSQTLYALVLARPFLDADLQTQTDRHLKTLAENLPRVHDAKQGASRVVYDTPLTLLNVTDEIVCDDLARVYPLWLWSRTAAAKGSLEAQWPQWRKRLQAPSVKPEADCGNARLAGLLAYCRMAREMKDQSALEAALPVTRAALRARLRYELAHTRGGLIRDLPPGGAGFVRWRHLTPDVARLLAAYAKPINARLMANYVDHQRPGWWLAWNVEQLMRNEVPYQLPTTPLEIFTARALLLGESSAQLANYLDLPWCRADEYYVQKLALALRASTR